MITSPDAATTEKVRTSLPPEKARRTVLASDLEPGQSVVVTLRVAEVTRVEAGIRVRFSDGTTESYAPTDGVPIL